MKLALQFEISVVFAILTTKSQKLSPNDHQTTTKRIHQKKFGVFMVGVLTSQTCSSTGLPEKIIIKREVTKLLKILEILTRF